MTCAATSPSNKRPSFYEVILAGSPKVVRGFLAGLELSSGRPSTVIFSFDAGIHHEDMREKLSELIHVRTKDCHVVVDAATAQQIRKLAAAIKERIGVQVTACRHVRSAELSFKFRVYGAHRRSRT